MNMNITTEKQATCYDNADPQLKKQGNGDHAGRLDSGLI